MKIAVFTPYNIFKHGGVQQHVQYQVQLLRSRGHDVTVITPRPRKAAVKPPEGVVFLGSSRRIKTFSATRADVSITIDDDAIEAELAKNYDVIHVHEPLIPVAARQILTRAEGKAVRVGTFHAALPGNVLGRSVVSTYKTWTRTVLPHVDVITAVSPAAIGFIDDYREDKDINYIANGIHVDMYEPKAVKRDQAMVLFVGRLEKRKGARQTIKAFAKLKQLKPDAKLKIAGDGPLRKSLEQYVIDNEIADIEFLGYISDDEKVDLMSRCGIYTSPALYGESFGIVLAEAMAMQAPIVAHPNDGYSWVLKETGRLSLVDCKDADAYAARMQLLLEDNDLRKLWQKWAKKYVKQFDYKKIVDAYEKLYNESLK